ncbi:MAG: CBASS cGAMP synthase [Bacteroidales bacterium]
MANCNKLFLDFDKKIDVLSSKDSKLKISCKNIRIAIRKHFSENHPDYKPKFAYQGSSQLGTMIRTKGDTCDYDLGVYFEKKPDVSASTLQGWIWDSVESITNTNPVHKNKCIRVIYQGDYHIDLPVYYKPQFNDDSVSPEIAIKSDGFSPSDPRAFIKWFRAHENYNSKSIRTISYLKAWCDHKYEQMPNGLTISLLVIRNIVFNDREDIMVRDTLSQISNSIKYNWECVMPTTPQDDLFTDLVDVKKENFKSNLANFITDATKAIEEERNQLNASKLWKKHLGFWFPEGKDEDVDCKENALREISTTILTGAAKTNQAGKIQDDSGVPHIKHSNFGGE